jgi:hypothetical protein
MHRFEKILMLAFEMSDEEFERLDPEGLNALLDALTPRQTARFTKWLNQNHPSLAKKCFEPRWRLN